MLGSVKASGGADWSVLIMDAVTTKVKLLWVAHWRLAWLGNCKHAYTMCTFTTQRGPLVISIDQLKASL
jgi:hypothetical protein